MAGCWKGVPGKMAHADVGAAERIEEGDGVQSHCCAGDAYEDGAADLGKDVLDAG